MVAIGVIYFTYYTAQDVAKCTDKITDTKIGYIRTMHLQCRIQNEDRLEGVRWEI